MAEEMSRVGLQGSEFKMFTHVAKTVERKVSWCLTPQRNGACYKRLVLSVEAS